MYARVARYEVPEGRLAEAEVAFGEAAGKVQELEGLEGGLVLVGEDGKIMTVTLWTSRTALEASETRAGLARRSAASSVEGEVKSVEHFEVTAEMVPLQRLVNEASDGDRARARA